MAGWSVHLKSSLWDTDAHSFDFVSSFRCVQRKSSTWHRRSVSYDWEIHRYFPKTRYTRDHLVPLSNSYQSFRHPRYLNHPLPMLAPLFRSCQEASDAKKVRDHLLPSFIGVLVKLRLPETLATTAASDCNTNSYLPFSPQIAGASYQKVKSAIFLTCLVYYL